MKNEGPYINPNIQITAKVPSYLQYVLDEMAKYSIEENSVMYWTDVDDLFVYLKRCYRLHSRRILATSVVSKAAIRGSTSLYNKRSATV